MKKKKITFSVGDLLLDVNNHDVAIITKINRPELVVKIFDRYNRKWTRNISLTYERILQEIEKSSIEHYAVKNSS